MSQPVLRVQGLCKSYGALQALVDVDVQIEPGEIRGLLGPNGAGKTTLVSIVTGIRRPDSGSVHVLGEDAVANPYRVRPHLGWASQEVALHPAATVRRNVRYFGELYGVPRKSLIPRINELAEILSFSHLMARRVGELSLGEKRRIHTAIALVHRPSLLLLDEPTAGADVQTRVALIDLVKRLAHDGAAVCYSTHYLHEMEVLGADVTFLDEGRVIASGSVPELIASHGQPAVELVFDGAVPVGIRNDGRAEVFGNVVRVRAERPSERLAAMLQSLGADASRLQSVEIVHASLESVYLAVTGRRYAPEPSEDDGADST